MKTLLRVENLVKRFTTGDLPAVDHLGFEVKEGEIYALLGPSGCGKTTALRLIAGFERADEGSIALHGETVESGTVHTPPEQRDVGLVFQEYALFPHLSVRENVAFGLSDFDSATRDERVDEVLEMVGLHSYGNRPPHELSGGEQQRVALARAIAPRPQLILLDEPFSNLDALLRQNMREEVRRLLKETGMTGVMVTHDQEEALSFADRVGVMRQGQIDQEGTPEDIYYHPRTLFVAQFLGRTNLLLSTGHGEEAETALGRLKLDRPAHGNVLVSIRPEHLTLEAFDDASAEPPARVTAREFKGHDITYRVHMNESEYLVHTDNRKLFDRGDPVRIRPLEPAVVLESAPDFTAEDA